VKSVDCGVSPEAGRESVVGKICERGRYKLMCGPVFTVLLRSVFFSEVVI